MPSLFRCAHISDLHFAKPSWSLSQFFSKRWLGNLNLLFLRKRAYAPENLYSLIDTFTQLKVSHVFITGDLSTTSLREEFGLAHTFVSALQQAQFKTFVLPGNHDQYTRQAYKDQLFYQFFDTKESSSFKLKTDGLSVSCLGHNWWLITLDTALATPIHSSCGLFNPQLESNLEEALRFIPSDHQIILMNHFPFFQNDLPRKLLKRGNVLRDLIQRHPNIRLFLHGHTHRHCIADLRASGLPIILDSGSTAHKEIGSWNFIDITQEGCQIEPFYWQKDPVAVNGGTWAPKAQHTFTWGYTPGL